MSVSSVNSVQVYINRANGRMRCQFSTEVPDKKFDLLCRHFGKPNCKVGYGFKPDSDIEDKSIVDFYIDAKIHFYDLGTEVEFVLNNLGFRICRWTRDEGPCSFKSSDKLAEIF